MSVRVRKAPAPVRRSVELDAAPSAVALNTAVASSTDRKAGYRFTQTANNLSVVPGSR